jgi:putative transposase
MEVHRASHAYSRRVWAAQESQSTRDPKRDLLRLVRSGCQWRLLPHDFPRWPTVYHYYFRKWRIDGTWERIDKAIRERLRVRLKRDPQPSAGIVDSQSVKTTGVGGEQRGYDGGKKIDGRKHHLLVGTEGFVLSRSRFTAPRSWTTRGPRSFCDTLMKSSRA